MSPKAQPQWHITDHVCVCCFGRILSRPMPDADGVPAKEHLYRCACCGIEKRGSAPSVICTCGFKVKGRQALGLKCEANPQKSPEFPAEIIARQA